MKCRPGKWLYWLPLAALPFLAAWWLNSANVEKEIAANAETALKSVGADWAKLHLDGRDALLSGEATSEDAVAAAVRILSATGGIRRVDASQAKVVVPVVLALPTITSLVTNNNRPEIRGTWPEGPAKTLALTLPDRGYRLGQDPELKSDGKGNWTWNSQKPMDDGTYEMSVEVSDGDKSIAKTPEPGKLIVDTVTPPPPTFLPIKGDSPPEKISGTWAEGDATSLNVRLDDKSYSLGKDQSLSSQNGRWTLKLPPLGVGKYQLDLDTADDAGNVSNVSVADAIIVSAKPVSPTVEKYAGNNPSPTINGTYDKEHGRSLNVAVGGKSYLLGTDSNLTADPEGHWVLAIGEPLKDGYYDVVATTADASGETAKDSTVGEVVIDTTGPAAPTVDKGSALPITGTFAAAETKRLRVTLAGKAYTLGHAKELSAEGDKWKLAPSAKLDPGTYDVAVAAADQFGNLTLDATRNEITVAATTEPPPPPPAMTAPTVNVSEQTLARPAVSGTWPEGYAKSLKVTLAGRQYVFATDAELTSAAGVWMLKVAAPLKDGVYDVVAEIAGPDGKVLTDATKDELTIDAAGPPIPTVALYSGDTSPSSIAGTWGEGDAVTLAVSLAGKAATLGTDRALSSDGKGNWTLAVGEQLKPGGYDVGVTTTDKRGRVATDQTRFEILVKDAKAVEPPPSPPLEMKAPTVDAGEQLIARPAITGTWSEGVAKTLKVSLAGKTYVLGTDDILGTSAGRWTLAVQAPLSDGIYDVAAETADEAGKTLTDTTKNELIVDAAGPAPPTVNLYSSETSPSSISGTWAEGDAISLAVTIAGKAAKLGDDRALSSDGKGGWALALSDVLKSGSYDVAVTTADKRGRTASDQTRFEIVVKELSPVEPPPAPPKVDCNFELAKTLIVTPIHFETDKSAVPADASATIKKLAGIAGQCAEGSLEIGGHTDVIGSDAYNQALSERRAVAVTKAMIGQGVLASRLKAAGYGETMPLATNETEEGRAVNRRIEIKIIK